ncbi:hypothetical protein ACHAXA_003984 [Cyclostephanos tholiformis]|uniref:peptidylprolyl isomerase n=1 Tax=Cyclostephanos tholiformis TaxID=382380 RepID=A0ABD3R451_9STRA
MWHPPPPRRRAMRALPPPSSRTTTCTRRNSYRHMTISSRRRRVGRTRTSRSGGGGGGGGDTSAVPHKDGDRVVYDWSGYTIGYFGRPFEAKGGPQGGAFDKDLDYFRTVLGSNTIIPGLDSALRTMKVGGIRQVIVPYGPLSYPSGVDRDHDAIGPKPTTFSGMRALNFVLENPRVDRTLLFNLKLIRVDRGDGKGGFIRGGS